LNKKSSRPKKGTGNYLVWQDNDSEDGFWVDFKVAHS
jgi:hypothetical protein